MNRWYFLVLIAFIFVYLFLNLKYLLLFPPIWPDEAIYADIAQNFNLTGRFWTQLWAGLVPGIEKNVLWYPPLFLYLLGIGFRTFGSTILVQRTLSLVTSLIFLLVLYKFSKKFLWSGKNLGKLNVLAGFVAAFTGIDYLFLKSAHISRPEVLVLFFGSLSAYFAVRSKSTDRFLALSALSLSLAFLSHFGALIFLPMDLFLIVNKAKKTPFKELIFFILFFASPILIWFLLIVLPSWQDFQAQLSVVGRRRLLTISWVEILFMGKELAFKLLFLSYFAISLLFIAFSWKSKNYKYIALSVYLLGAWLFAYIGQLEWYFVLPVPFIYLALAAMLIENTEKKLTYAMLFLTVSVNVYLTFESIKTIENSHASYQKYSKSIREAVPVNKSIYLSAIPDPYFSFDPRKNQLYEFPAAITSAQNYLDVLNKSDYAIYNSALDSVIFGNLFDFYVKQNVYKIGRIGDKGGYKALIIEFKPRDQRKF